MHRIDGEGHVAGLFTEGDPGQAIPATVVTDDWLNAVQEEICNLLTGMGVTLDKGNNAQLVAACVAAATAHRIVRRDAAGRAQVADPSASADIDTKGARDAAIGVHNAVTNPHSAASAATASRLALRDAAGRCQFADPSAAADADTKGARDAAVAAAIATPAAASAAVTAGTNWSATGGGACRKSSGGLVIGQGHLTAGAGAVAAIGVLPAGHRPPVALRGVPLGCNIGAGYETRVFEIGTDGVITALSGTFANGDKVYLANVAFFT